LRAGRPDGGNQIGDRVLPGLELCPAVARIDTEHRETGGDQGRDLRLEDRTYFVARDQERELWPGGAGGPPDPGAHLLSVAAGERQARGPRQGTGGAARTRAAGEPDQGAEAHGEGEDVGSSVGGGPGR